ncbi:disease resistance protein RPV1-like [Eucalyptus grandis]|uniref:disease resistance protein RPV1-like n=1 Tax=Eucalyptus grandis TaxID=71139 RepID=UPI00192E8B8F|nr:disease resistance protein RPV1-like [Eucalyptus grandis]XP_039161497.1 disease resistance protein RPV1-like [Eucalyptus grandis]XP_039161498.1 disease resistance protein RPV1-like [Eucalyptus grandis]
MVKEGANSGTATDAIYDVFLSFRGSDTRNGFTDFLYVCMTKAGIRTFRDDEELEPGKNISEILQEIKNSHIYIPILSEHYAESEWCLRELTLMVQQMVQCNCQSMKKEIVPIFYDVDPSDVRLETELYKSALRKLELELGLGSHEIMELWKGALVSVAQIKGWHIKDKRQGKAAEDITQNILQKITRRKRDLPANLVGIDDCRRKRDLPANLVGIDDCREDIKTRLHCCDISDVRFVIIHGINGIGKTTLAKAVFNEISHLFEGCCFLSDIRESSLFGGIVKMQRKFLKDLFDYPLPETSDFEEGNNVIKKILPCKQVLLVFDDLDGNDQFMQLLKLCTSCRPGSRIIITTRDKSAFPKTNGEELEENILIGSTKIFLYKMREMHFDDALLLFNKLVFDTNVAPCDDLSRDAVALAGGLPLAVEEISSLLCTKREEMRKTTLKKLKEVPPEKVHQSLKISYDALGYEGRQIFLDIACFFVNKKITNAMYMWDTCDLYPAYEIDILINKSLITDVGHDRVSMQDPLRDCGREIVRQEHVENYGDRSRLWSPEKALDMVLAKKGTNNVKALKLQRSRHNFTREHFANLVNVRFLELDGGNFVGNFEDIFPELRWLCWRNCPPKLQANNFILDCLVVLKLSGDFTAEYWSGWVKIMVASNLKVLKLAGSKSLIKTPRLPKLVSLERLVLKDFLSLAEIDCSINQLEGLTHLKIKWCPSLKELPQEIGSLTKLRELILIHGFSVHYLPYSISNLRLLSRLVMEDTGVVELPDTIKGLVNLQYLCLAYCSSLNSLSDAVGELKSLTELDLSGTSIEELPRSLCNLKDLKLRIKKSLIKARRMGDLLRLEDIEDCWSSERRLESDGILSVDLPVLPELPNYTVV